MPAEHVLDPCQRKPFTASRCTLTAWFVPPVFDAVKPDLSHQTIGDAIEEKLFSTQAAVAQRRCYSSRRRRECACRNSPS